MRLLRKGIQPARVAGFGIIMTALGAPAAHAETKLVIRDFVLAHEIDQREPRGATDFFRTGDGKAVAFARIWNGGQPTVMHFVWHYGEKIRADVPVTVGKSPAWRTWSTVNLRPGTWRVALVDAGGTVLAERAFTVDPAPSTPAAAPQAPAATDSPVSFERAPDPFSSEVPASADSPAQ